MYIPTVSFDFDGVIHSYRSGWKGAAVIPDPPVEGIKEVIEQLISDGLCVVICSSRAESFEGQTAIAEWLKHYGFPMVQIQARKVPSIVHVDDRTICFDGEITVIRPSTFAKTDSTYHIWKRSCENAEVAYFDLLNEGCTPQEARSILPNSLKTEVVMTADLREWRHFCRMRCPVAAHPNMRVVANMLLTLLKQTYPVFFEDIEV